MKKAFGFMTLAGIGMAVVVIGIMVIVVGLGMIGQAGSREETAHAGAVSCDVDTGGTQVPEQYQTAIEAAAAEAGIPTAIVAAQIDTESGFDENAESPVGARGIAQFMPATWAHYGEGDINNGHDSIAALGRYMADLRNEVGGLADNEEDEIRFMLAAYNAGPGPVRSAGDVPPYPETQNYVAQITSAAGTLSQAACQTIGELNVEGVGADDYPYREPVGADGWGETRSIFGHVKRQCTDFVMWRLNQAAGWSEGEGAPPISLQTLGISYGSGQSGAGSWRDMFTQVDGASFTTDAPRPGDIAWWGYSDIGGGFGHVGFVAAVEGDTAVIEHYNLESPNTYSVSSTPITDVPGFIRIPGSIPG